MDWKKRVFEGFRLYAVTDLKEESSDTLRKIEAAFRGGTDIVQLRSKVLPGAALVRLGLKIKKIAEKSRKLFFINDRVDIALLTGADGVHLGQEDVPVRQARKLAKRLGRRIWVGKSTHTLKQALAAVKEGADYIGVGPVFATPTKPNARSVGLRFVKQAAATVRIPWVAIGGIDLGTIRDVVAAGASRVALVRAIFAAKDPERAARELQYQLRCGSISLNCRRL
ncbi:MAG: thiamine phosphate synthase [Candidatus Omnitrophota bacterium]